MLRDYGPKSYTVVLLLFKSKREMEDLGASLLDRTRCSWILLSLLVSLARLLSPTVNHRGKWKDLYLIVR